MLMIPDCPLCNWETSTKVRPWEVAFVRNPEAPNGVFSRNLIGDVKKDGFYVARFKLPPNEKQPAHTHPDHRTYTVASGTMYSGLGTKFDESKLIELPTGSFYNMPANMPHFSWTKAGEVIMQVTGNGPSGFFYCDPADDPRNKNKTARADHEIG
jgi:quercetin dioxygenase-like cupin family protein